jgi:hypothetical protein
LPSRWGYAWFISVICVNQWSDLSLLGFYPRLSAQISGKVLFSLCLRGRCLENQNGPETKKR